MAKLIGRLFNYSNFNLYGKTLLQHADSVIDRISNKQARICIRDAGRVIESGRSSYTVSRTGLRRKARNGYNLTRCLGARSRDEGTNRLVVEICDIQVEPIRGDAGRAIKIAADGACYRADLLTCKQQLADGIVVLVGYEQVCAVGGDAGWSIETGCRGKTVDKAFQPRTR